MKDGLIVSTNRTKKWYKDNLLHREAGPAVELYWGRKEWWLNGNRHRSDGPAIDVPYEREEWWLNGKLHREDGPAVELSGGKKQWFKHGKRHRIDGPAVVNDSYKEYKEWWYNDQKMEEQEHPFNIFRKEHNLCDDISKWQNEYKFLFKMRYD